MWLSRGERILPSLKSKDSPRRGEQERPLHRDTAESASPTFTALSVARFGIAAVRSRRQYSGQRLHLVRRLTVGCKGLHPCSGLHREQLTTRTPVGCRPISRSAGVSRPYPRSYQERLIHARFTFTWSRITSGTFARSSRGAFVRGSITAEWMGSVARNRRTFTVPRAGYSEKGDRYA